MNTKQFPEFPTHLPSINKMIGDPMSELRTLRTQAAIFADDLGRIADRWLRIEKLVWQNTLSVSRTSNDPYHVIHGPHETITGIGNDISGLNALYSTSVWNAEKAIIDMQSNMDEYKHLRTNPSILSCIADNLLLAVGYGDSLIDLYYKMVDHINKMRISSDTYANVYNNDVAEMANMGKNNIIVMNSTKRSSIIRESAENIAAAAAWIGSNVSSTEEEAERLRAIAIENASSMIEELTN